jgi:hypothetical protein
MQRHIAACRRSSSASRSSAIAVPTRPTMNETPARSARNQRRSRPGLPSACHLPHALTLHTYGLNAPEFPEALNRPSWSRPDRDEGQTAGTAIIALPWAASQPSKPRHPCTAKPPAMPQEECHSRPMRRAGQSVHTRSATDAVHLARRIGARRAIWQDVWRCECSLTLEPAHTAGPVPVVAESARRTSSGVHGSARGTTPLSRRLCTSTGLK